MPTDVEIREQRRAAIRRLLKRRRVESQGDLVEHLAGQGFLVTQSSVSRDLKELGVVKVDGRYRIPALSGAAAAGPAQVLAGLLRDQQAAGPNLLVVRTVVGGASRVGLEIDRAGWSEVIGTVAGDDTLFLATAGRREQKRVMDRIARLAQEGD